MCHLRAPLVSQYTPKLSSEFEVLRLFEPAVNVMYKFVKIADGQMSFLRKLFLLFLTYNPLRETVASLSYHWMVVKSNLVCITQIAFDFKDAVSFKCC